MSIVAILEFLRGAWSFIKPYWKYILIAIVALSIAWYTHHWYEAKLDEAYKAGVAATQAVDAEIIAERKKVNDQIVADLKISAATKQAELEDKIHENELVADDLRTQLRAHRVCTDERSGRAVSGDTGPASDGDGTSANAGPVKPVEENSLPFEAETVGDDLVTIGESCQASTDKLIALQGYVKDLMTKLNSAAKASRRSIPVPNRTR